MFFKNIRKLNKLNQKKNEFQHENFEKNLNELLKLSQHFISMCEKLCKHCAILSFIRYIKKIKLSKNLKKFKKSKKMMNEKKKIQKSLSFFLWKFRI